MNKGDVAMISTSISGPFLSSRAMLCSLSISMWSARKHDREASEEIAERRGAQADAGRYHKVPGQREATADSWRSLPSGRARFFASLRMIA
jgi:hypothetical protein